MAGVDKNLLGLLNGIAKREYYGEEGITDDFLREELYEEMDETNFEAHLKRFENLMKIMVNSDMDFRQLEAFLTSQMKRREGALTEEQAAAISRFWKNHKTKIHDVVVQRSSFGNTLKQTNWRIDLKTHSRHLEQINTPVAIYELEVGKHDSKNETEKIRFEMDSDQLNETLMKMERIKDRINKFGNG
eukprot:Seg1778.10 transcript_id=Seg1778.10/GoldUCD/mRNA.D3Y31 product="COMM domain-containing protein 1" protein_id=Seg1778.10/GoldUCD/D3Y31